MLRPLEGKPSAEAKRGWGNGPWAREADRWSKMHHGFRVLALRGAGGEWWGYVGLPPDHPWYGLNEREVPVHPHAGVQYAGLWRASVYIGPPDLTWWIGFGCNGRRDYQPAIDSARNRTTQDPALVYRTLDFVIDELERLGDLCYAAWCESSELTPPTAFMAMKVRTRPKQSKT